MQINIIDKSYRKIINQIYYILINLIYIKVKITLS